MNTVCLRGKFEVSNRALESLRFLEHAAGVVRLTEADYYLVIIEKVHASWLDRLTANCSSINDSYWPVVNATIRHSPWELFK